ncbi:GPI biosynthesis protein [Physcia stellaris]|nr:GPI biosynthesis protein [Physcia stellaris]
MDIPPSSTSTTTTTDTPALPSKSRKITPVSQPIPILATPLSRSYAHIHPIALLSLSYACFPSLVSDPVPTLLSSLLPLSALQLSYTILCLPPHSTRNSRSREATSEKPTGSVPAKRAKKHDAGREKERESPRPGPRKRPTPKKDTSDPPLSSRIVPALLSLLLTLTLVPPILFAILVLFGAPLTTHLPHTYLLATHIALLTALPLFYVHGVDGRMWREVSGAALPGDEVWGGAVGTVLGAWVGAVPIPLDWDREWQKWPVTIVTGAIEFD